MRRCWVRTIPKLSYCRLSIVLIIKGSNTVRMILLQLTEEAGHVNRNAKAQLGRFCEEEKHLSGRKECREEGGRHVDEMKEICVNVQNIYANPLI